MHESIKKIKYRILLLFLIPAVVMFYFTFQFAYNTNQRLQQITQEQKNLQKIITILEVIHALQKERGMSAGYISQKQSNQQKLLQAQNETDKALAQLEPKYYIFFEHLKTMRLNIAHHRISLHEEMQYYSRIVERLIGLIKYLLPTIDFYRYDTLFVVDIEALKEAAGIERACIYSQLLTNSRDSKCIDIVLFEQEQQNNIITNLLSYASAPTIKIYNSYMKQVDQQEIDELRKLFKEHLLSKQMAPYWFKIASNRIDSLQTISLKTIQHITYSLQKMHDKEFKKLNIAVILWVFSIVAALYFLFLIEKIFKRHTYFVDQLTLASYTFDSYEGIVITDPQTRIIKANKGFERITGYTFEEVAGEKINILKSGKHPTAFYEKMWNSINTTGSWSGKVLNKNKDGHIYHQQLSISTVKGDDGNVQYYVGHIFDITSLIEAQQQAVYQATHDHLTSLINRKELIRIMQQELIRVKRQGFMDAFLFIDLDNFKQVNDTHGHHMGDAVLQHIANTITSSVREGDIVARISGDEFGVVLLDLKNNMNSLENVIENICLKILKNIEKPTIIDNTSLHLSVSIGVRIFPLNMVDTVDTIIREADFAMYQAKADGKNKFNIFQS